MPGAWLPPGEWVQCIPNLSEGRDRAVMDALAGVVAGCPGVLLTERSSDVDHNRMVLSFIGGVAAVEAAALALAGTAVQRIDLTRHAGVHPRFGALDVLPFVPLGDTSMESCVRLAHRIGGRLAEELALPVFFYEEAAHRPERKNLAAVRAAASEGAMPDAGPPAPHRSAGATAVGARGPLIAFNVNLATDDLRVARRIAERVRERGGGPPGVRALGLFLESRGCAQVSMNLTRPDEAPISAVFELVRDEAAREGVDVAGSELVGSLRLEHLADVARHALGMPELRAAQVLDPWLARLVCAPEGSDRAC